MITGLEYHPTISPRSPGRGTARPTGDQHQKLSPARRAGGGDDSTTRSPIGRHGGARRTRPM
ncbi:hypothetical protein PG994_015281 [Apiospora phragmitis]|uniref:Uncharacterized protein n=1 Tax=Apiospora phragmitis TaxID=2905665 RepID=A0ABR1SST6_9PEZI